MKTTIKNLLQNFSFYLSLVFCGLPFLLFGTNNVCPSFTATKIIHEKQITIVITKETTLEELQKIKKQMTDEGFGFDYSNVVYNKQNEITAINIWYKDANNNSGNYSVSSENPINNITIASEGTRISVRSVGNSNQAIIQQGNNDQVSQNSQKAENDMREAMNKKRAQMEMEMETQMKEMEKRQAEMERRMKKQSDDIRSVGQPAVHSAKKPAGSKLITCNTTDSELLKIQEFYNEKDISVHYKSLERNKNNQITKIYITVDNRNGSVSTSNFGNGMEPIKNITLAVDKQNTIMANGE
ncbi:hypothetical protein QRD02_09495 [Aequorivita sp. SDUM287046]|uniref:Uncharacterized protein n=1 Tax=Aequorivita aurantiaca TaxID=3053356 RepID=A0ABT8DI81_9FLAO|nr:hypothetical protein [Aequorivita aurantiaca]MDN3724617.1 hypothetical protein [Aequorivita aurantiaca]